MENVLPDFFITPTQLVLDEDMQPLDGQVYAIIYWYTKLKLEKCVAKNSKIAELLRSNEGSIKNSITRLVTKKYIKSIYNRSKHQRELIPLITFQKSTSSKNDLARHQMMPSTSSNDAKNQVHLRRPIYNTKKEDITNTIRKKNGILKKREDAFFDEDYLNHIVEETYQQLQDEGSLPYFRMVAQKVPETVIKQFLAEIKADGAKNPTKLFIYKIERWAAMQLH